jgi:hypothetical protein
MAAPKPSPNPDGGAKERVPSDQQTRRHDTPEDENDESAIHQVRRQHRWCGGIHSSEQLRMDASILQPDVGKPSENGSQAGERIVARWQAVSLRTGRRLPEHRLNPVL